MTDSNKFKKADTAECTKCGCSWFEQFWVNQYSTNHTTALGQKVAPHGDHEFVVLRCVKCNELFQPNVMVAAMGQVSQVYSAFKDELDTPANKKPEAAKVVVTEKKAEPVVEEVASTEEVKDKTEKVAHPDTASHTKSHKK